MLLALSLFVLLLSIALFQSTHGFFSALIMMVLAICCAATAVGTYEWVAVTWIAPMWKPGYAAPIALAAVFAIPLGVLRLAADNVVPRAPLLPSWVDRLGGGACGFITAMIVTGILATSLEMIPFHNGSIFGYARVPIHPTTKAEDGPDPKPPEPNAPESELWLKPDRFAVALAGYMSHGLFSDRRDFLADNPDLIQAVGWGNAAPAIAARYAPPNSIAVVRTEPVRLVYRFVPGSGRESSPTYEPLPPRDGYELQMVRVQLKREARLDAKSHIFTLRQFRLVGMRHGSDHLEQFYPIAIQQEEPTTPNRHIKMRKFGRYGDWPVTEFPYMPRTGNNAEVEVVFELPEGFQPEYIEYKRAARVRLSFDSERGGTSDTNASTTRKPSGADSSAGPSGGTAAAKTASTKPSTATGRKRRSRRGGNIRGVAARSTGSHFGDAMPVTLKKYTRRPSTEITAGALVGGHLIAYVDQQEGGTDPEVARFKVPDDKRLLHLNTEQLQARSGLGKIISQTVQTLQNYFVTDARGNRYKVVGKYALANVDGRRVWEIQYFSSPTGSIGGLGKFDKIKSRHMTGDYRFSLLFLVDPGARIVSFSTGSSATRQEDLDTENLVAPK